MAGIKLNRDNSEIIAYNEPGIPIYISEGHLSDAVVNYKFLCHWHEDMEFIYIKEGSMDYHINGKIITLAPGTLLLVNSGRLHYGFSETKQDCYYHCVLLHPSLITTNKILQQKFIQPVTDNGQPDFFLFTEDSPVTKLLLSIINAKTDGHPSYELEVLHLFQSLWLRLYTQISPTASVSVSDNHLSIQRQMVSFIYQNYHSTITLEDIAASGKVCRSKCCQIFKKYMGQSPMDFVNSYRLEYSQQLLERTDLSITEICLACGFNHQSYFTKQFRLKYQCTPKEYRKFHR